MALIVFFCFFTTQKEEIMHYETGTWRKCVITSLFSAMVLIAIAGCWLAPAAPDAKTKVPAKVEQYGFIPSQN